MCYFPWLRNTLSVLHINTVLLLCWVYRASWHLTTYQEITEPVVLVYHFTEISIYIYVYILILGIRHCGTIDVSSVRLFFFSLHCDASTFTKKHSRLLLLRNRYRNPPISKNCQYHSSVVRFYFKGQHGWRSESWTHVTKLPFGSGEALWSLTRVTKSYRLALGTTQISSECVLP